MGPKGKKRESDENYDPHLKKKRRIEHDAIAHLAFEEEESAFPLQPPPAHIGLEDTNWPRKPSRESDSGSSASGVMSPVPEWRDKVEVTSKAFLDKIWAAGQRMIKWIDDPDAPDCPVQISTLTLEEVLWARRKKDRYMVESRGWEEVPVPIADDLKLEGFSTEGAVFRDVLLRKHGRKSNGERTFNEFGMRTCPGVIVGEHIFRYFDYHWSDVALAFYKMDFSIDTLKHLYFTDVANLETAPYVRERLYRQNDIPFTHDTPPVIWPYNTPKYLELMGTALGKSAACLVLGAWPRGTHRIERIESYIIWGGGIVLRFDIEPVES